MAISFKVPASPTKSIITISEFLGVDFTNSPAAVDERKSPDAPNMIRDVPGKVRKSMGYFLKNKYSGRINGAHFVRGSSDILIHAGTSIYLGTSEVYSEANNERSKSWQFDDKLYIVDGKALLVFDGETVKKVQEEAYTPILTISKEPAGGGTQYEDLNLINPAFTELFLSDGQSTAYHLSFGGLDSTAVKVEILQSNGNWVAYTEGTQFTVDRTNGIVNFTTAPGKSPLTGEDNVKITAYRTVDGYADRINKCNIGAMFGVNGALDRLFLSGNPDFINYDWYSQQYDPTYYPDTGYSVLGSGRSAVVGYSVMQNYLAAHKDEMERDQSIILRSGDLVDDKPSFKIVNVLQGPGSIGKHTFAYLSTEPVFLTRLGVYAVTAQDITGEKYSQNRSFFVNGRLLNEENLEDAFGYVYKDLYWLCLNNVAYILDGLQPVQTDKSMPYATRQYVCFFRKNIPARCMWEHEGHLFIGSNDGSVFQFYDDPNSPDSYNDNGNAIEAYWETPDFDGKYFYKNKTFRYMAVRLAASLITAIDIWAYKRGVWSFLKRDDSSARYFRFSTMRFSTFTFSSDNTEKIVSTKLRIKKVDKSRFRLKNAELNQPFGLFDIAFEYVESGNHK